MVFGWGRYMRIKHLVTQTFNYWNVNLEEMSKVMSTVSSPFVAQDLGYLFDHKHINPFDLDYTHRTNVLFRGDSSPVLERVVAEGGAYPRLLNAAQERKGLNNVDHVEETVVHTSRNYKVATRFATTGGMVICFKNTTGVNVAPFILAGQGGSSVRGEASDYAQKEQETLVNGIPLKDIHFIRPTGLLKGFANVIFWNTTYDPSNNWFFIEHGSFNSQEQQLCNKHARWQGYLNEDYQVIPASWAQPIYQTICAKLPGISINKAERALRLFTIPANIDNPQDAARWLIKHPIKHYLTEAGHVATNRRDAKTSKLMSSKLAKALYLESLPAWEKAPADPLALHTVGFRSSKPDSAEIVSGYFGSSIRGSSAHF